MTKKEFITSLEPYFYKEQKVYRFRNVRKVPDLITVKFDILENAHYEFSTTITCSTRTFSVHNVAFTANIDEAIGCDINAVDVLYSDVVRIGAIGDYLLIGRKNDKSIFLDWAQPTI